MARETNLTPWTRPESYGGAQWDGWYYAPCGQHRDSDALQESNFAACLATLLPLAEAVTIPAREHPAAWYEGLREDEQQSEPMPTVYHAREGHWAVGWVEHIYIHESNTAAMEAAEDLQRRLDDYPALDEDDWSEREDQRAAEYWASESIAERVRIIHKYAREDTSVFAARRDELPSDYGIYEYLRTP